MNKKGKSEGRSKPSKPSERAPKGKSAPSGARSAKPASRTTRTLRSDASAAESKSDRSRGANTTDRKPKVEPKTGGTAGDRRYATRKAREEAGVDRKSSGTDRKGPGADRKFRGKDEKHSTGKMRNQKSTKKTPLKAPSNGPMRLNKYIANSGVCSRRDADVMIGAGVVTVNDVIVTELGAKVNPGDVVKYDGQTIKPETMQYVLLNKPKNFTTNLDDALGRRSVMGLIKGATREVVVPVGKLDRDTTGLLLFTNDASLATRLIAPSGRVRKIYHVTLAEKVKSIHLDQIRAGIEIDGHPVKVDEVSYVGDGSDPREVGMVIYSSKHNIAKSIFEHFGYTVTKLDRVIYAGLTKKDLPRGRWRLLSKEEIGMLYMTT